MKRPALLLGLLVTLAAQACGSSTGNVPGSTVEVAYAGSLTRVMEDRVQPRFEAFCHCSVQGEARGSMALANLIKDGIRRPDVFISADPAADEALAGPGNGDRVSWWVDLATTQLVIGWDPKSRYAPDFLAAQQGRRGWQSVLREPGLRLGRTDPNLDPKGYRTLWLFELADRRADCARDCPGQAILAGSQVFPEEEMVARLQTGGLDAAVLYQVEAVTAHLPYLKLPPAINQGDPALAADYARVSFTTPQGLTIHGTPILYTITVPNGARNRAGALAFVRFLLGQEGQQALQSTGVDAVKHLAEGPEPLPAQLHNLAG